MRIDVDRDACELHAQCVFAAPRVFSIDEDDELRYDPEPAADQRDAAARAALACPAQAIRIAAP